MTRMQRAVSFIFPDQCLLCTSLVDMPGALCSSCWRETPFIRGLVCDGCGTSLPGASDGAKAFCDDCIAAPRPWLAGRAALSYREGGRRFVLALKHADRPELARPAAVWMTQAGQDVLGQDTLLVPVPVHWSRMVARRYNQAAELSRAVARSMELDHAPDALERRRRTPLQDGLTAEGRFANVADAIFAHEKHGRAIYGRSVCLVDDVMTSGATLSACAAACLAVGAASVSVLVLARVEKTP